MKTALFIVNGKQSPNCTSQDANRRNLLSRCNEAVEADAHAELIREGVYLLLLDGGLKTLGILSGLANDYEIECRALFFDDYPAWVPVLSPSA